MDKLNDGNDRYELSTVAYRERDLPIAYDRVNADGDREFYIGGGNTGPEIVYCNFDEDTIVGVVLDRGGDGIKNSNLDEAKNRGKFAIRVNAESWKLPADTSKPVLRGTVVKIPDPAPLDTSYIKSLQGSTSFQLLGGPKGDGHILELSDHADSRLTISSAGTQMESQGQVVSAYHKSRSVKTVPETDLSTFGEGERGPFKDNMLGAILPKAFLPGLNTPNHLPSFNMFQGLDGMMKEAADLTSILRG